MKNLFKMALLAGVVMATPTDSDAMSGSMRNSDEGYVTVKFGMLGSMNDGIEIKELQNSDFFMENETTNVDGAAFNTLYGTTATDGSTSRTYKYGTGFSGAFAYGFDVGGSLRADVEIYGKFQKPDSDTSNTTKSDYLGVNIKDDAQFTATDGTANGADYGTLRADGTGSFSRIGAMFNVQLCASCLFNTSSKLGAYLGVGAGAEYFSLYKASKLGVSYQIRADIEYPLSDDVMVVGSFNYGGLYSPTLKGVALKGWDGSKGYISDGGTTLDWATSTATNPKPTASDFKATGGIKFTEATFGGSLGVKMVL